MKNAKPAAPETEPEAAELDAPVEIAPPAIDLETRVAALEKRMSDHEARTAFIAGMAPQAR